MNLLSELCPLRGEGRKAAEGFQGMGQVRQLQKGQLAQKEKSAFFNLQILAALLIHS